MQFEGEDQRALSGLVRTLSGRLDFLMDGDRVGPGATTSESTSRYHSVSDDVSEGTTLSQDGSGRGQILGMATSVRDVREKLSLRPPASMEPPECRVCRGEPEPGRILYAPCLCSGSIMHTHEDCLLEWLRHSGKDSCELCGALFRFTPVYHPDAPESVPVYQVLATCAKKAFLNWLPLLVRVILVASLWLLFVPVCTSWLYRIWIHRSRVLLPQLFLQRLNVACVWSDCISGIIVTAAIILSFLSLMTFADFLADQLLRDEWGGMGLDGINLVEAMAEAMDDLRIDNQEREEPPPPVPQQQQQQQQQQQLDHREDAVGDGGLREGDSGLDALRPRNSSETRETRDALTEGEGTDDGFTLIDGEDGAEDGFQPAVAAWAGEEAGPMATSTTVAAAAALGRGGSAGKRIPTLAREGESVRHLGSSAPGIADERADDAVNTVAVLGKRSDALLDLDYRPPTPPRRGDGNGRAERGRRGARGTAAGRDRYGRNSVREASIENAVPQEARALSDGRRTPAADVVGPRSPRRRRGRAEGLGHPRPAETHALSPADHGDGLADTAPLRDAFAESGQVGARRAEGPEAEAEAGVPENQEERWELGTEAADGALRPNGDVVSPSAEVDAGAQVGVNDAEQIGVEEAAQVAQEAQEAAQAAAAVAAEAAAAAADMDEDNEDMDDGFLDGDLDVHMAIDELLGIRGPITMLLRNVLWLLAFHGAYLGLFAFFPFSIGASVVHAVSKYLDPHVLASLGSHAEYLALRDVVQSWYVLATSSEEQEDTLRLPDLATICLGYMVMSTMVFMWRGIINAISERTNTQILRRARKAMRVTAAVVKVGLLLSLKMLLLPLLLGVCLDATTLSLFGCTGESRARFMAQHLVGSLLLHWVLGITFMLFVTVSVLQLREVVHPDLLSLIIRPQEPHPDLLGSLLQESGRTHARRMAMSLAIYLALVAMFVWMPTKLVGHLFPSLMPVQLELRYSMPQLQIPAELVILHLAMLAFLEKYQNRIGEMQHAWLVAACSRLGLTRFVLPQPIIARHPGRGVRNPGNEHVGVEANRDQEWLAGLKAWWDGGEAHLDEEEGIVVGPPLRRPPPGWDDPAGVAQGRWAWGTEPAGEVQLNLAPRRRHGARAVPLVALLVVGAWATVLAVALCLVVLPFLIGRGVFLLLHLPPRWTHDTASFSVGLTVLKAVTPVLHRGWSAARAATLGRRRGRLSRGIGMRDHRRKSAAAAAMAALSAVSGWALRGVSPGNRSDDSTSEGSFGGGEGDAGGGGGGRCTRGGGGGNGAGGGVAASTAARMGASKVLGAATVAAGAALWLVVAPLLCAGLFEAAFVIADDEWRDRGMLWALPQQQPPMRTLALGAFLLHTWAYLCQVGVPRWLPAVLRAIGALQPRAEGARGAAAAADGAAGGLTGRPLFWQGRMEAALSTVELGVVQGRWEEVSARTLLWNFTGAIVVRLSVMLAVPALFATLAGVWTDRRGDADIVASAQLFHFRVALVGVVLGRASAYLVTPTRTWLEVLHDSVRDDRYLVGMRLQNHSDKASDTAEAHEVDDMSSGQRQDNHTLHDTLVEET